MQASGPSGESAEAAAIAQLPADPSSHAYNRDGAVAYAISHGERPTYNPDYPDYDDREHGDCTNFVSQALYEGGNVSMFIPNPLPPPSDTFQGEEGWYLLWAKQRATDWNDVGGFYTFVTNYAYPTEGPEGTVFPAVPLGQWPAGLMKGDVIQYNEESDAIWDHAVIVIGFDSLSGEPLVASHSPNTSQVNFKDVVAHQQMRFIHIERSDGYPPVKAETQKNPSNSWSSDDAGTLHSPCTFSESANEIYFGACAGSGATIISGFRFKAVQIPKDAHIRATC